MFFMGFEKGDFFIPTRVSSIIRTQVGMMWHVFFVYTKHTKRQIPSRELTYPPKMAFWRWFFLFPRWDMLIPWRVSTPFPNQQFAPEKSMAGRWISFEMAVKFTGYVSFRECTILCVNQYPGLPTTIKIMVFPPFRWLKPLGFSNGGYIFPPIVLMVVGIPGSRFPYMLEEIGGQNILHLIRPAWSIGP